MLHSTDYSAKDHNSAATKKGLINIGVDDFKTHRLKANPMTKQQLEFVKKEIKKISLFLISHTEYDPKVVEIMKLSALADAQKSFENWEPW